MEYIPKEDYIDYADDLCNGEQININHTNCTAGEDTRRRLYIKRTEDGGNILAYCHNCSLSGCTRQNIVGYSRTKARSVAASTVHSDTNSTRKSLESRFANFEQDTKRWRLECKVWLSKYGITDAEIDKYKLKYDAVSDSLVLPVFRDNKLLGWQARAFTKANKDTPKYDTRTNERPLWWYSGDYDEALQSSNEVSGIVLVEDMVSGIKCSRYMPTIALLGANFTDKLASFAIDKNKSNYFIIFLDDDNRQIKLNQLKIKNKLEQMGYQVKLITGVNKDPKECSNKELENLLCV